MSSSQRILLSLVVLSLRLYFANSGLKTRLNLLNTGRAWWTLGVLVLLASVAKIVPVTLTTKLFTKQSWYYCASMGVLMNTRGIVQLVVLNIGVQLKVISPVIFAMFVLMATILTFLTSPILYFLYVRRCDPNAPQESSKGHDHHVDLEGDTHGNAQQDNLPSMSDDVKRYSTASIRSSTHGAEHLSNASDASHLSKRHRRMTLF